MEEGRGEEERERGRGWGREKGRSTMEEGREGGRVVYADLLVYSPLRPVVFSIDDSREYQADFVLATLHDSGTSCGQHETTSSTLASRAATTGPQKPATPAHRKGVENGRRRRGSNGEGPAGGWDEERMLQEEEGARKQSTQATRSPGRVWGRRQGSERGWGALHQTMGNGKSGQRSPENESGGNNVPPPPPESDPMEEEEYHPESQQRRGGGGGGGGEGGGDGGMVSRVFDPMDVLFGEENTWDVAEEGVGVSGFGMHPPAVGTAVTKGGGDGGRREEVEGYRGDLNNMRVPSSEGSAHGEARQSHLGDPKFHPLVY